MTTGSGVERQRARALGPLVSWAEFPVDANPRPWVFVGPMVWVEGGFRTNDAKLSFLQGDIAAEAQVPNGVLDLVRQQRSDVIGATHVESLVVVDAERRDAAFQTDRGEVHLPAWALKCDDANGPIWVLDPEVAAMSWTPPHLQRSGVSGGFFKSYRSRLEADSQTLHFEFVGAGPEFVEFRDAIVVESRHALAVIPILNDIGPPGPRRAKGFGREVVVELEEPLGARVLVNLDATPVQVVAV